MFSIVRTLWASVLITIVAPASAARRAFCSDMSRRFGLPLISSIVPLAAAASATRSTSMSYGRLRRIIRPVRWPMQSTRGCSIAATNRSVIVVRRPVGEDVRLGSGEELEAPQPAIQLPHLRAALEQGVGLDVVSEAVRRRVVGD